MNKKVIPNSLSNQFPFIFKNLETPKITKNCNSKVKINVFGINKVIQNNLSHVETFYKTISRI